MFSVSEQILLGAFFIFSLFCFVVGSGSSSQTGRKQAMWWGSRGGWGGNWGCGSVVRAGRGLLGFVGKEGAREL